MSMAVYRFLADLIVWIHLLYASFIVFGLVAILAGIALRWGWVRNFWFRTIHFLMIALVVAEVAIGVRCPLTAWEGNLREWGGEEDLEPSSFLGRMAGEVLFFPVPEKVCSAIHCLVGAAILLTLVLAPPRLPPWLRRQPRGMRGMGSELE